MATYTYRLSIFKGDEACGEGDVCISAATQHGARRLCDDRLHGIRMAGFRVEVAQKAEKPKDW